MLIHSETYQVLLIKIVVKHIFNTLHFTRIAFEEFQLNKDHSLKIRRKKFSQ
jgi:hypothetical protein